MKSPWILCKHTVINTHGVWWNLLGENIVNDFYFTAVPFLCLSFVLTEEMKEPGDQDTNGRRLARSKSDGKLSQSSLKAASRCK